ncbi:MAG: hypothetical protein ACM31K_05425 [Solirubrobacterales bacterium]
MNLFLLAAIVTGVAALGVLLMHAIRRGATQKKFYEEIERGSGIFAFLGTAFAVLLAFVVLEAFQNFNDARSSAETEATDVAVLSRYADYFPADDRDRIVGGLICYGRAVANVEWKTMESGQPSPLVQPWVGAFENGIKQLDPKGAKQTTIFFHMIETDRARGEARRQRLTEAGRSVPGPVWFILILGAALTIGIALLFADRREPFFVQGALMAAVCALVTSGLLLVWFLDHPYGDQPGNIRPSEMEKLLVLVETENPHATPPCNSAGEPPRPALT